MLAPQLNQIRQRLDAVKTGKVQESGFLSRARAIFDREEASKLEMLHALDHDFDRAGIHTAADAKLLRELGKLKGRLGGLSEGLAERAQVALAEFESVLRRDGGEMLESLQVFDEYRGDRLPAGVRSVGWRLQFRHPERTLRDKELEGRRSKLVSALQRELGVSVRG